MQDKFRTPLDLGRALKTFRHDNAQKTTRIAIDAGRSRDILNRLEKGQDVTLHALFDILRAMNLCLRIERAGLPTMEEMHARFAADTTDDPPPA